MKEVIRLQEKLLEHKGAKLLAVRHVTQDSYAKKVAGVDNRKALKPNERLQLAENLQLMTHRSPLRKVWIQIGTKRKRCFGIPTLTDRALQTLVLMSIEPEWEAKFEPNNYGFRIARQPADALKLIRTVLIHDTKWVYCVDIEKCFCKIHHDALLNKLIQPTNHPINVQIKMWLENGIIEDYGSPFQKPEDLFLFQKNIPQGSVISPILANIALHGLENWIKKEIRAKFTQKMTDQIKIIRYADDLLIMTPTKDMLNLAITSVQTYLNKIGLNRQVAKTRVFHTLNPLDCLDGENSFSFLGMKIQQVPVGKHKATKASGGRKVPWVVKMLPHPTREKWHFDLLRKEIKHSTTPMEIIRRINPIIHSWTNYFHFSDGKTYGRTSWYSKRLYILISNWQKRQYHTKKPLTKLWKTVGGNHWVFYAQDPKSNKEYTLADYGKSMTWSIVQYVQVNSLRSPYDGDWAYWSLRMSNYYGVDSKVSKLIKKQKGYCRLCQTRIQFTDRVQVDHITPRSKNGSEDISNLQLCHIECHLKKTIAERNSANGYLSSRMTGNCHVRFRRRSPKSNLEAHSLTLGITG